MTITCRNISDRVTDYIPRFLLRGWIEVNLGEKIPVHIDHVESLGDRLGLDGSDIYLKVSGCEVCSGDILSVENHKLYVC